MAKAVKYLFVTMAIVELIAELMHWREFIFVLRLFVLPCLLLYYVLAKGEGWQPMHKLMVGAIFFSYVGDVSLLLTPEHPTDLYILGIPKSKYLFIAGIAGYMVSHFYFIGAYRQSVMGSNVPSLFTRNKWAFAPVLLYGLVMASIVVPKVYADAEKSVATLPVLIYTTVLCSMVAFAINRQGRVPGQSFWWVMVGSLLFLFSDSLIAINFLAFPGLMPEPGFCIMSTFLAAEFLIAEGMIKTKG